MNDFEKLKKHLADLRKLREEIEISVKKANDMYEVFSEMNDDCDAELEEIDEQIEDLTDEMEDEPELKNENLKKIDELKAKRKLVAEAADVLEEIIAEYETVSEICTGINVGY